MAQTSAGATCPPQHNIMSRSERRHSGDISLTGWTGIIFPRANWGQELLAHLSFGLLDNGKMANQRSCWNLLLTGRDRKINDCSVLTLKWPQVFPDKLCQSLRRQQFTPVEVFQWNHRLMHQSSYPNYPIVTTIFYFNSPHHILNITNLLNQKHALTFLCSSYALSSLFVLGPWN